MSILKKALFSGLAVATLASAGVSISSTSADAGYRYGHRHYGYTYHAPRCYYKYVWRTDYYGNSYRQRIRVCG